MIAALRREMGELLEAGEPLVGALDGGPAALLAAGAAAGATAGAAAQGEASAGLQTEQSSGPKPPSAAPSLVGHHARRVALPDAGVELLCAVSGVGKVAAAATAAALVAEGAEVLLVVGTCGGLQAGREPGARVGDFVHATAAIQWDLAVREGRESRSSRVLLEAWTRVAGGTPGAMLTADRPAIRWLERARRARALLRGRKASEGHGGPPETVVADMETAAIAAVAARAGLPWAALRVISDRRVSPVGRVLGRLRGRSEGTFADHFAREAPRPAATILPLITELARPGGGIPRILVDVAEPPQV